jgi:hypothetical protein
LRGDQETLPALEQSKFAGQTLRLSGKSCTQHAMTSTMTRQSFAVARQPFTMPREARELPPPEQTSDGQTSQLARRHAMSDGQTFVVSPEP